MRGRVIGRVGRLSWGECRLFLAAYLRLTRICLALRVVGFKPVFDRAERAGPGVPCPPGADSLQRARLRARWLASAARRQLLPAHCLAQSLALHHWLRAEGVPSVLRIGVRKDGARLAAHAWVELGGVVVNDSPVAVAAFQPLAAQRASQAPGSRVTPPASAQAPVSGEQPAMRSRR